MKKALSLILCVIMVMSMFIACEKSENDTTTNVSGQFTVGYGAANISPKESLKLSGFGDHDERYSTKVTEQLMVTCIAVTGEDGETILLLAYDLLNSRPVWTEPTRKAIYEATGIPVDHIMVTCSHTHSAPHVQEYPVYQELVKQQSVIAAEQAMADRAPATMQGSYMRIDENVNCNRHYLLADGTYMGESVGSVPKDQLIGHFDEPDNLLQVVKFEREEKKDIVMMNWQAHYLGSKLDYYACTSDYPGVMRTTVENALDCHSLFILSASGNLNSWSQLPNEMKFEYHTDLGKYLGEQVISLMDTLQPMGTDKVQISEAMHPSRSISVKGEMIDVPLYALAFGELGMVFAPYEMFDTIAMGVRDQSPFPMTMVATCSNDSMSYVPTPPSWDWEYKYEVRITKFEKGTAEEHQEKFVDMLSELYTAAGLESVEKGEGYVTPEFVPSSDGITYLNPSAGNLSACEEVANGFYKLYLLNGSTIQTMLAIDKETAEAVLALESAKLLFNQSHVIVGIAE